MSAAIDDIGLLLAVMPIFISAAEQPIRRAFNMPFELKKFYRALDEQRVQLRLNLIILFGKMPSLSEQQQRILADEEQDISQILQDSKLQEWAHEQLGIMYRPYMDNLDSMMESLSKLVEKDRSLKLKSATKSTREELRQLLDECEKMEAHEQILRRIHFSKSSRKRSKLLADIQTCNDKLQNFSNQIEIVRPILKSWHDKVPKALHHISDHAFSLYDALVASWNCSCCMPYATLMRLETRHKLEPSKNLTFKLVIGNAPSRTSKWQQMEVSIKQVMDLETSIRSGSRIFASANESSFTRPSRTLDVQSNPPFQVGRPSRVQMSSFDSGYSSIDDDSLAKIEDICGILADDDTCKGLMLQDDLSLRGFYTTSKWHDGFTSNLVSLRSLIQSGTLRHGEKLHIAVQLASTLLELNTTPWLKKIWTSRDIKFSVKHSATQSQISTSIGSITNSIDANHPLLENTLKTTANANVEAGLPPPIHPNISVLCLGIMLLEVYFGHTIEDEWQPEDLTEGRQNSSTNWSAAKRWLDRENNGMSIRQGYWKATFHCIHCFFDPMPMRMDLHDKDFREVLYRSVLSPLEKELKAWNSPL